MRVTCIQEVRGGGGGVGVSQYLSAQNIADQADVKDAGQVRTE